MRIAAVGIRLCRGASPCLRNGNTARLTSHDWQLGQGRLLDNSLSRTCGVVRGIPSARGISSRSNAELRLPILHRVTASALQTVFAQHQQQRHFWRKRAVTETVVSEKEDISDVHVATPQQPRISFYSSGAGQATYVNSLSELPDGKNVWDMLTEPLSDAEKEHSSISPKNSCWLDVTQPTVADIEELSRRLNIHRLTTEDILARETQEKVEVHASYTFISYCAFDTDQKSPSYLSPVNVYILTFPHGALSLRLRRLTLTEQMEKRLDLLKNSIEITPEWIAYALIDEVTDNFVPALKPIQVSVESLSGSLTAGQNPSDMLKSMANARTKLMTLRRLLGNKTEVVKALIKRQNRTPGLAHTELSLNLSDVQDHLLAISQDLNHWEEVISQSENNCLMQLNLQMSQANNDASEAISKLTVLSTVILPLNVITGLWGMNVLVPGQGMDSLHWFGGLASVMVVVACSGYFWATRLLRQKKK